jgi:hypothetical protein
MLADKGRGCWYRYVEAVHAIFVAYEGVYSSNFNLRHKMGAMLRVVRRIDRTAVDTITSAYLRQAKADRAANVERAGNSERRIRSHH